MNWWQYVLSIYFGAFAAVFVRVSALVNRKRAELKATRGLKTDESGRPLTYLRFLPDIIISAATWPLTILWRGLHFFLKDLM